MIYELKTNELKETKGGAVAINIGSWAAIGAAISFVIGVIDGFTNPKKCNN